MTFKFKLSSQFRHRLNKLAKKDRALALQIRKKISQIINCNEVTIQHFKNLRRDLSNYKRVHIGPFVLFFEIRDDIIIFDRLVHHDDAY